MNDSKIVENIIAIVELITNEIALLKDKPVLSEIDRDRLKVLNIQNDTLKAVMGVKQYD